MARSKKKVGNYSPPNFDLCVFINCPYDKPYAPIERAIIFAILDSGFSPRSAKEYVGAANRRMETILQIMRESRYAIHDISRKGVYGQKGKRRFPRFNMPFELGVFQGFREVEGTKSKRDFIVLDTSKHDYDEFLSDMSGQDTLAHDNDPEAAAACVRNWLASKQTSYIPSADHSWTRFLKFEQELPNLMRAHKITPRLATFREYSSFAREWTAKMRPAQP